jgi:hypothetical protein
MQARRLMIVAATGALVLTAAPPAQASNSDRDGLSNPPSTAPAPTLAAPTPTTAACATAARTQITAAFATTASTTATRRAIPTTADASAEAGPGAARSRKDAPDPSLTWLSSAPTTIKP